MKDPFATAIGIPIVAFVWNQWGNEAVKYVSEKVTSFANGSSLPTSVIHWFGPYYLVGVTIGSQVFIDTCNSRHSPTMNFIEKSIIGTAYYTSTVIIGETIKTVSNKILDLPLSTAVGVIGGAIGGGVCGKLFENNVANYIDKGVANIDNIVGSTVSIFSMTILSLIGKSKGDETNIDDFIFVSNEEVVTPCLGITNSTDFHLE
jgi:phosphate/sulfate permease